MICQCALWPSDSITIYNFKKIRKPSSMKIRKH